MWMVSDGLLRATARDMARGVSELYGLISSVSKSLGLVARTLVVVAREAPALVMATLLLGFIATTYLVSQVWLKI